jgi:AraC-like DNA-binding protein
MTAEPPLLPATSLHALLAGFRELGLDTARIAASLEDLPPAEAGTLVPAALYEKAWREAGRACDKPALATATGLAIPFGAFGMIDYLCGSAATVAGGFESLVLHYRLAATDNRVEVESIPGGCKVAVHPLVPLEPHVDEFTLAVLAGRFRRLTGGAFVPSRVLLRGEVDDIAARAALMGCPVLCGQPVSAMEIDAAHWKAPIMRADPLLHQLLATLAARESTRTARAMPLESALRARLRDALADSDADVARMARLMGLSVRTLQRRLAQAGRSYAAVVDDFRREESLRLVANPALALARVAGLLGYAEQASFTRAFARWHGTSPGKWRQEAGAPSTSG